MERLEQISERRLPDVRAFVSISFFPPLPVSSGEESAKFDLDRDKFSKGEGRGKEGRVKRREDDRARNRCPSRLREQKKRFFVSGRLTRLKRSRGKKKKEKRKRSSSNI